MAMYGTRENKMKFSTEYAERKAEKEAFVNVDVAASTGPTAAAAWSSDKNEDSATSTVVLAADAPMNAFTLTRYSDARGFLAYPVTANTVRRHMEACISSGGSSENSYGFHITTPKGEVLTTSHVKITWLDLPEPIRQVGTRSVPVTLSYFDSATSAESSSVTMPIEVTIKHTSVL
jgi:hypothetical protein